MRGMSAFGNAVINAKFCAGEWLKFVATEKKTRVYEQSECLSNRQVDSKL